MVSRPTKPIPPEEEEDEELMLANGLDLNRNRLVHDRLRRHDEVSLRRILPSLLFSTLERFRLSFEAPNERSVSLVPNAVDVLIL